MHALDGDAGPGDAVVPATLCASCIYGAVLVVDTGDDESPVQRWVLRCYCRCLSIAGSSGTHEIHGAVGACTHYSHDPQQERP